MRVRPTAFLLLAAGAAQLLLGAPAARAAGGSITTACAGTVAGSTFTLTADCDTTATLSVPDGFTVVGAGHEITAHDPDPANAPAGLFHGAVLTNAGTSMDLTDLTVRGTGFAYGCDNANPTVGILYHSASGTMTRVNATDITQHSACLTVHSIMVRADTGPQTVTITDSTTANFQRSGLLAMGDVTLNASGNTFGPPDLTIPGPGRLAQNSLQIGSPSLPGTGGTVQHNTIITTAYGAADNTSTGVLVASANHLLITQNTFGGAGADIGVVVVGSQDVTVSYNHIARTAPDRPGYADTYGYGVSVDDPTQTRLICNTFDGWNLNLDNITQPPCIITTGIPCATVGQPYQQQLQAYTPDPGAPLTWSLVSGPLPPGLTLSADGVLSGTPTTAGDFPVRIQVSSPDDGAAVSDLTFCVEPAASPTPTPTPTVSPSPEPTGTPEPGPSASASPSRGVRPVPLAETGSDPAPWLLAAAVLIGIGTLLTVRRLRR
ncbi:right-handed parallel beta-helix repeat-containing protein [Kitasatospora sp. CB02891]|uniref:right-handed parallel beta-helix repeat-containing protein n=1 Tax=Kitasatospora sp. CB02891 TaxID=2020329 RepID=UPI000C2802A2|nr:right-handed parallel beta-helix repeat-containing protein [Kitasatospora sp. CB02891]PJN29725.1 hypothetical protein CG736_04160 [Kitasatospora sp. CB02891]